MPMPTLVARTQRTSAQMRAFQVNMKSAATAPTWKRIMKLVVNQLGPF